MKSISQKIKDKGIKSSHVAKMVGIDQSTLSRIIRGSQSATSEKTMNKIHYYLDSINTDDKDIFREFEN